MSQTNNCGTVKGNCLQPFLSVGMQQLKDFRPGASGIWKHVNLCNGHFFFHYFFFKLQWPIESKMFTGLLFDAYVGMHQRILVFDNYQKCPVPLIKTTCSLLRLPCDDDCAINRACKISFIVFSCFWTLRFDLCCLSPNLVSSSCKDLTFTASESWRWLWLSWRCSAISSRESFWWQKWDVW